MTPKNLFTPSPNNLLAIDRDYVLRVSNILIWKRAAFKVLDKLSLAIGNA